MSGVVMLPKDSNQPALPPAEKTLLALHRKASNAGYSEEPRSGRSGRPAAIRSGPISTRNARRSFLGLVSCA